MKDIRIHRTRGTGIRVHAILAGALLAASVLPRPSAVAGTYYPPPESKGGWRTLVTKNAAPTADQKAAVRDATGLDMIVAHQTARPGGLEQVLSDLPAFCSTLLSKVMAAVVTPSGNPSAKPAATVERWDAYERSFTAAGSYANPFQDVTLTATFTHASLGTRLTVDGFHDGGSTWRLRFMPLQLGTWHWMTSSNDRGLDGKTGTLECVTPTQPYLRGPLMTDGFHFRHADGSRRFLISTRLTCQFAPPSVWPPLISFLQAHRINRVLFMMPGVDSRKDPVHTQRNLFAPGPDYTRYRVETFRAIDAFVDTPRQVFTHNQPGL